MNPDLDLVNKQIRDLQKMLSLNLDERTRQSYYDTLTFLLDTRALLIMRGTDCLPKEELN